MTEDPGVEVPEGAEQAVRDEVEQKITGREEPSRRLFGAFGGVFVPTLLTILGVIMYLREGWVVGNAGLLGAWLIILLSFAITTFTALSLSSITTNIRIGAGGAFSVISQSLGLEVGGSIGIPFYISQALAVAMYIFGFRAGWLHLFPDHPALLVDLLAFALLFAIGYISAGLAFKIQYLILAVIIGSLASIAAAGFSGSMDQPVQWWGAFPGSLEEGFKGIGFWAVFAVFFPASTGIMAGANMSGDLKNPRRSIPVGTLSAIGVSLVIYLLLAWWLAASATTEELTSNYTIMIDRALWGPLVLAGLLGATFSSALSSIVGAPRILQALAEHRILPGSSWLAVRTPSGEPRNAMLFTGVLVIAALMVRDLNAIAPLITMFFLITYAMINAVVLIEQNLGLVSFRPLLRIPRFVSFIGAAGCIFAMFIVNLAFGVVALAVVLVLHAYLVRKHLKAPYGDVRSGLFVAVAEWAAKKVERLAGTREKTWKANLLVPVEVSTQVGVVYDLLRDIARPKGFVRLLGLTGRRNYDELTENLPTIAERFHNDKIFATWTVVQAATFSENVAAGLEALGGAFFRSNMVFLRLPESSERSQEMWKVIGSAARNQLGVVLYAGPEETESVRAKAVHLIVGKPGDGWRIGTDLGDADLGLLVAFKLKLNRKCDLVLSARIDAEDETGDALDYLKTVTELARIPDADRRVVRPGEELSPGLQVGVTVFSITGDTRLEEVRSRTEEAQTPCLFTLDSGRENALV
ncbi:MAG TPA: amino acid permease [Chondromyces sp.]|nr:amino acid permease [Chondromyces sp.]